MRWASAPICALCWSGEHAGRQPVRLRRDLDDPPEVCTRCGGPTIAGIFIRAEVDDDGRSVGPVPCTPRPRPPRGVSIVYADGTSVPTECYYAGLADDGVHEWVAINPRDEFPAAVRIDLLPALTSIVVTT